MGIVKPAPLMIVKAKPCRGFMFRYKSNTREINAFIGGNTSIMRV